MTSISSKCLKNKNPNISPPKWWQPLSNNIHKNTLGEKNTRLFWTCELTTHPKSSRNYQPLKLKRVSMWTRKRQKKPLKKPTFKPHNISQNQPQSPALTQSQSKHPFTISVHLASRRRCGPDINGHLEKKHGAVVGGYRCQVETKVWLDFVGHQVDWWWFVVCFFFLRGAGSGFFGGCFFFQVLWEFIEIQL